MPCSDGMDTFYREQEAAEKTAPLRKELVLTSAVLCGMIKAFGLDAVVEAVHWEGANVTREDFIAWRKVHQAIDKKVQDVIIALLILAVAFLDARYAILVLWRHGSSDAFGFCIFLSVVFVVLLGCAWHIVFGKRKGVPNVKA